jgi:general stress protein 26
MRQQPEDHREDLRAEAAVAQIREIVGKAENCFFCTTGTAEQPHARPMNVRHVDDDGTLWFLSASESSTNKEIGSDPSVRLYFQGSAHSDFLELEGEASITRDRAKIKELWKPVIKTWFTGGVDDPRITVIKVTPTGGYYWDTKHGNAIAAVKMLIGAATGRTLDDSVEGNVDV